MDVRKFKLGLGPMSRDIVNLSLEYSKIYDYPIMLIASRNQVDYDSGYAFTTRDFVDFVKNNENYDSTRVLICRDHCGPYFSDVDKALPLNHAVDRCIQTIKTDIESGFDLIHIDVGRVSSPDQETVAVTLFDFALSLNPNIMFEFGSEDNTSTGIDESIANLDRQLNFVQRYKPNLKFFVTQTGSLTKHTQVGTFDAEMNLETSNKIHSYNLLFKEHNGDYLNEYDISLRSAAGIDSVNIAPQLGFIQSSVLHSLRDKGFKEFHDFFMEVVNDNYWKKWVTDDNSPGITKFLVSAHYMYSSPLYHQLLMKLNETSQEFNTMLRTELFSVLDKYRLGLTV